MFGVHATPAQWTPAHVRERLIEAFDFERRLPGRVGPDALPSGWLPKPIDSFADMVGPKRDGARGRVEPMGAGRRLIAGRGRSDAAGARMAGEISIAGFHCRGAMPARVGTVALARRAVAPSSRRSRFPAFVILAEGRRRRCADRLQFGRGHGFEKLGGTHVAGPAAPVAGLPPSSLSFPQTDPRAATVLIEKLDACFSEDFLNHAQCLRIAGVPTDLQIGNCVPMQA
jgi:hypothetical protein